MLRERNRIEEAIQITQSQLKECPVGRLICSRNGKYSQWRWNDGTKQIYIPKKKRKFAEKLAYKKYLLLRLKNLIHEKMQLSFI